MFLVHSSVRNVIYHSVVSVVRVVTVVGGVYVVCVVYVVGVVYVAGVVCVVGVIGVVSVVVTPNYTIYIKLNQLHNTTPNNIY